MPHFQYLGFANILFALNDSPNFEFKRRCPRFADGSRMISTDGWKSNHKIDRAIWRKMGLEVLVYKKNDIYVATIGSKEDFSSVGIVLESLGAPSQFRYGRHSNMDFRYDKLYNEGKVEETYVHVDKIGRPPWLLEKPTKIKEITDLIEYSRAV
ncbi:hypothetical protein ACFLZB_00190 [Nanoarchaeota archaeon]